MTLTTAEVVTVDGVDLNTLAYNLETLSGRDDMPPRRGENRQVAYRHGRTWTRKQFDQKTETWAMWVRGCAVDGTVPGSGARAEYNKNLFMLKQLFGKIHTPLMLQRQILMPSGLLVLTAEGECNGPMSPAIVGNRPTLARFTADIELADPFWYGPAVAPVITTSGTITNPGTGITTKMQIAILGPATDPIITNTATGAWVKYTGVIASGITVTLDTDLFTAVSGATNVIAGVTHGGASPWMELLPGANPITVSTAGVPVTFSYQPAYV